MKSQYHMYNLRYWQQSIWNYGLYCASVDDSGFLVYQHHITGIVLYYWSSLRCIKIWIVIYYRGLKFPHRAAVLIVLESDGACTSLNVHCARKTKVLVLVWCYKAMGEREQDLWRYCLPEGCIKKWYNEASGYGCLSNKCLKGSSEAVTLLYHVPWPSTVTYRVKTQDSKDYDYHHCPQSTLT